MKPILAVIALIKDIQLEELKTHMRLKRRKN